MTNPSEFKSYFDDEFWKTRPLINILGDGYSFGVGPILPTSWVVCAGYYSEPYAPVGGYPTIFPTIMDCLLWFRWVVLGYSVDSGGDAPADSVELDGVYQEIANFIDQSILAKHASPLDILDTAINRLEKTPEDLPFWIGSVSSIHDYMAKRGNVKQWREALGDERPELVGDEFVMPAELWDDVIQVIDELIDCDGSLREPEDEDAND